MCYGSGQSMSGGISVGTGVGGGAGAAMIPEPLPYTTGELEQVVELLRVLDELQDQHGIHLLGTAKFVVYDKDTPRNTKISHAADDGYHQFAG